MKVKKSKGDVGKASPTSPQDDQLIRDLSESAFEFLERAIGDFNTSPKFSTIYFATAVELFIKARLMREHWSLALENPDRANRKQFTEGAARTVNQGAAIGRLRNLVGLSITQEAEEAFKQIAEHRNRMVHFVHETGRSEPDARAVTAVAIEQCRGWLHLHKLLAEWRDEFEWLSGRLERAERQMAGHREFLSVRFEALKDEITRAKLGGTHFRRCDVCSYEAAMIESETLMVARVKCLVCSTGDTLLTIDCPNDECGCEIELTGHWGAGQACSQCDEVVWPNELRNALDTSFSDPTDPDAQVNCALCMSHASVVPHENIFVCTECFGFERGVGHCEWCNEGQLGGGDLEFSYRTGCEFCEGAAGWERDD